VPGAGLRHRFTGCEEQPSYIEEFAVVSVLLTYLALMNYSVFQKSDAKIQITITTAHLIRINYPLSSFNYRLSGTNVANFNKIHRTVSEQQLYNKKLIRR